MAGVAGRQKSRGGAMKRPRSRTRAAAAKEARAEDWLLPEAGPAPPSGSETDCRQEQPDGEAAERPKQRREEEEEEEAEEEAAAKAAKKDEEAEEDRLRERAWRGGPRGPGAGGKGRSRREREQRTNWRVPAGHERKIAAKIRASRAKRRRQQRPGAGPRSSAPEKVEEKGAAA